jgi:hypothetical protein
MTNANARDPTWREGYEAALRDLERLADGLHAEGAQGSDYRHASHAAEGIDHAIKHLRAKLAGQPEEAPRGVSRAIPAEVEQREWTEA